MTPVPLCSILAFHPNLAEYTGTTSGLPKELWPPTDYKSQPSFYRALGFSQEELSERVPEFINFCVWCQYIIKHQSSKNEDMGNGGGDVKSSPQLVQKSMQ
jgi:hypothetical protein